MMMAMSGAGYAEPVDGQGDDGLTLLQTKLVKEHGLGAGEGEWYPLAWAQQIHYDTAVYPSVCPASHPWAYRPKRNFDYCCSSGDDRSGNVGVNALADRSKRTDNCKGDAYVACLAQPCRDYSPKPLDPSECPASHPWAYRPKRNFDYCCSSGDDKSGNVGVNALTDRSKRTDNCKGDAFVACLAKPCRDHSTKPTKVDAAAAKKAKKKAAQAARKAARKEKKAARVAAQDVKKAARAAKKAARSLLLQTEGTDDKVTWDISEGMNNVYAQAQDKADTDTIKYVGIFANLEDCQDALQTSQKGPFLFFTWHDPQCCGSGGNKFAGQCFGTTNTRWTPQAQDHTVSGKVPSTWELFENTNNVYGKAQSKADTDTIKYIGIYKTLDECREGLETSSKGPFLAFTWHEPDFADKTWAGQCFGSTNADWSPRAENLIISGKLQTVAPSTKPTKPTKVDAAAAKKAKKKAAQAARKAARKEKKAARVAAQAVKKAARAAKKAARLQGK